MSVTADLGKNPIAPPTASDAALKESPAYESMSAEIAKLSSIQDAGHVQWPVVLQAAQQILSEQAKDIPSTVYLATALAECEGLSGWHTGGRILIDVLQLWWEEALPPKKRMRARVNAIDWWHERSKQFLSREHAPITGEEHQALKGIVQELDSVIGEKLPDCQPLYDLREALQHLEIKEAEVPTSPTPETATTSTTADGVNTQALSPEQVATTPGTTGTTAVHNTAPAAQVSTAAIAPPTASVTAPSATVSAAVQPAPTFDPQDPELLKKCQKSLVQMARQFYDAAFAQGCPQEALPWHSLYMSLWGGIEQMPTCQGRNTMVPAPDNSRLMALQTLLAAQKYEQAAHAAAVLAPASPFCFDAHHCIAQALQGLIQSGAQGFTTALTVMEQHTKLFIQKFSGIENLFFADESPFASDVCKAWLESIQQGQTQATGAKSEGQNLVQIVAEAQRLCHQKQLPQALDILNVAMKNAQPAAQLRLQITQVRLLSQEQHFDMAVALAENILRTLDKHQLDQWDNPLCEEALLATYGAYKGHEASQAKMAGIAQRIAVLNPSAALKLL